MQTFKKSLYDHLNMFMKYLLENRNNFNESKSQISKYRLIVI